MQRLRSGSNDTLTTFPGFGTTAGRQPSVGSEHRSNYTFTHSDTRSVSHHTPSSSRHLSKDLLSAEKDMLHDTIEEGSVNSTENRGSPGYNPLLREALLETQGKSFYNGNKPPPVYQIHS